MYAHVIKPSNDIIIIKLYFNVKYKTTKQISYCLKVISFMNIAIFIFDQIPTFLNFNIILSLLCKHRVSSYRCKSV